MPPDRWIIEAWYPAEHYGSPASWAHTTHATIEGKHVEQMGPYPAHGDYEHVATIQTKDGGYAALTPTICDMIVDLVRSNQDIRRGARKSLILAEEEKKDRRWDSEADSILNDTPSFHLKPHIIVPSRKEAA